MRCGDDSQTRWLWVPDKRCALSGMTDGMGCGRAWNERLGNVTKTNNGDEEWKLM